MESFADDVSRDPEIKEALVNIEAWGLSARPGKNAVSVFGQNGLLLIELRSKAQILYFAREMGYIKSPGAAATAADQTPDEALARLASELTSERALRLKITEERNTLEKRLTELERQLTRLQLTYGPAQKRYTKLRTLLAREFHPDYYRGPEPEMRYRSEVFKVIWPRVEEIDKS